jgi:diamine N-acetyltransferase
LGRGDVDAKFGDRLVIFAMIRIEGENIILRSVDFSDVGTILLWENSNEEPLYGVHEEQYTREDVVQFVENQQRYSIVETEQLRLMICSHSGERLGAIDLAEYDGFSASVSIIIVDSENRGRGYGSEALRLMIAYAESIGLQILRAKVLSENKISRQIFSSAGFVCVGADNFELSLPHSATRSDLL